MALPNNWNWADEQRLSIPIRSQGLCACCWAIVVADLLTFYVRLRYPFITYYQSSSFGASSQELLDMVIRTYPESISYVEDDEDSCYGATQELGFKYALEHGVTTQDLYPYKKKRNRRRVPPQFPRIRVRNVIHLGDASLTEIQEAILQRPLGARIKGYQSFKRLGKHPIYADHEIVQGETNVRYHAIIIMGWGYHEGKLFYHVRNCWGRNWGNDGYAKVYTHLISEIIYAADVYVETL